MQSHRRTNALRALDQNLFPIALERLDSGLAGAMEAVHRRSFPRPWSSSDLRSLAEAAHCHGVAARCGELLVGFIIISAAADEAEIITIAVDDMWRQRGVGRALLEEAVAEAGRRGARAMLLEVGVMNEAAQALYERAGFVTVGRRKNYYKGPGGTEDALIMRREIPPCAA
jgi:[ribosomal protein S18]-alanine N-acetyltransferase